LFDFKSIDRDSGVINGGDIGFDKEEFNDASPAVDIGVQAFEPGEMLNVTQID
jgi:tRNA 2-thiocytidine biosynthesis protein TtcA